MRRRMLRIACFCAVLAACSNNDDLSGDWIGTWSGGGDGTVTESLSQSGDQVTGTATFTGSPCWNAAQLSLVVAGNNVSGSGLAGAIRVDMSATWSGDHIDGTFESVSGACIGTGTFALDRQ
jgi:hypothetical protein